MIDTLRKALTREKTLVYLQIFLGCLIGGAAYPLFLTTNDIVPGGLTGAAMIVNHYVKVPIGALSFAMNVPLFMIGWKFIGSIFVLRSLLAMTCFSLAIDVLDLPPLTDDPLLASVYGGLVLGIGLGLILRGGATTGGTDMIARMVHNRFRFITVGMFLMALDCCVVIAAGLTMGSGKALYALICIFVSSKVIDLVMMGFSANKACFIISDRWEEITRIFLNDLQRGVTYLRATGAFSGKDRPVVLCVISRQELPRVKDIVVSTDPAAFVFVTEAHEVLGEGFSRLDLGE